MDCAMTSEGKKCGISSLLPISCRDRAEAFARSLQSRLNSLGSENESNEERSWLEADGNNVTLSQQPLPENERYLALELLESPSSPQEEIEENELKRLLNGDQLKTDCASEVTCNGLMIRHYSADSDNEVFYDLDDESIEESTDTKTSNITKSVESETGIDVNSEGSDGSFATSLDCTPQGSIGEDTTANSSSEREVNGTLAPSVSYLTIHSDVTVEYTKINGNSSSQLEDDETEETPRVRRCSSLKTGKTPPGTPSRKKIVRFADVLGLDLADVRTFLDEIPKVPKSAYDDLSDVDLSDNLEANSNFTTKFHGIRIDRILVPLFEQPVASSNFLDLVRENRVCLENALVEDPVLFQIKGTVRVRNLDFHKSVYVRYSLDSWKSFADVQATYVDNSCDGFSDRFSFTIYAHTLTVGQKIEFACRFQCKGSQYWDNNGGRNYCFQCLPSATSNTSAPIVTHGLGDWGASFY
ncbi:hypothetical protein ABEB36_014374 [Hypothenemus hampei]|uniref:CBM21 domain-containing protein n=1 Tax=Hypothenemus hampei TaxID=57062 RepID=A0ABD1E471_HYPHA